MSSDSIYQFIGLFLSGMLVVGLLGIIWLLMYAIDEFKRMEDEE